MHLLYITQYFHPEVGATQTRAYEMAAYLVSTGHQVTLITEIPNHPSGRIKPGFRGRLYKREQVAGIEVIHVRALTFAHKTRLSRLLFYLSFMVSATLAGLLLCRKSIDLVYATSPPLTAGFAGYLLHLLKNKPFFIEIRDLWPESAVVLGELTHPLLIRPAVAAERAMYRAAIRIITVTLGIQGILRHRGDVQKRPSDILLIPNGANTREFQKSPSAGAAVRRLLGWDDVFIVMYAGILGVAQGLETLLHAARILSHDPSYRFLVVGDGPRAEALQREARRMGLADIRFLGEYPRTAMPAFYSASDAALVPLRRLDLFCHARPSKLFDAWACETPVLLGVDGEAKALLDAAGGGLYYEPENPKALAHAVTQLRRMGRPAREQMGQRARAFVEAGHSRRRWASLLERALVDALDDNRHAGP